jgi:hypothetical protein
MQKISLKFGWRTIIFFLLLELFTVPPVAMSNSIVIQNIWYMAIMGFIVALVCVYFLLRILKAFLIRNSERIIGVIISDIHGIWYIALLAGILLMIMFVVQDFLFAHNFGDFSAGFFSAFLSVGGTLLIYKLGFYCGLNISLNSSNTSKYQLEISWSGVLKLSLLFGIYELIVCPITGLWIPYPEHRFSLAVISGVVGGATGGALVAFISSFIRPMQAELILRVK